MGDPRPANSRRLDIARAAVIIAMAMQTMLLAVHVASGHWWRAASGLLVLTALSIWLFTLRERR